MEVYIVVAVVLFITGCEELASNVQYIKHLEDAPKLNVPSPESLL